MTINWKRCSALIVATAIAACLAAFQSPIVKVRNYSYNIAFNVDGVPYSASANYKCYLEDVSTFSDRGADWHIRGDLGTRVIGKLQDGRRYEAIPTAWSGNLSWATPEDPCVESSQPVASVVFIEDRRDASRVHKYDSTHTTSEAHSVQMFKSDISLTDSGLDKFVPIADQPQSTRSTQRYFTVVMGIYTAPHFRSCAKDLSSNPSQQVEIPLFVAGKSYSVIPRVPNLTDFVGRCYMLLQTFTDGADRVALTTAGNEATWRHVGDNGAEGWLPALGKSPSTVLYRDGRIDVPAALAYEPYYEADRGRIIAFYPEFFDLW